MYMIDGNSEGKMGGCALSADEWIGLGMKLQIWKNIKGVNEKTIISKVFPWLELIFILL